MYLLCRIIRPHTITGMIFAHLARVEAAKERYLRTSYWHTVVTRLLNAMEAYRLSGVEVRNESPVRTMPTAETTTVTRRFMSTRNTLEVNISAFSGSEVVPPYGIVIRRSCRTP